MNTYTIMNARLVAEPKALTLGGKDYCELRVADNPSRKLDRNKKEKKARFVTLKFWQFQAGLAKKLSKGDVIVPTGELEIETYDDKKTGQEVAKDVMTVTSFSVSKSESFYAKTDAAPAATDAPANPEDDLPF